MKQNLKSASRDYFTQETLRDSELEKLEAIIHQADARSAKNKTTTPTAIAASILILITVSLSHLFLSNTDNKEISVAIAEEVAKNHIKRKPLEITSNKFSDVSAYFTELEFSPAPSQLFASNNYIMQGGRYCSIKSVSAAQLRYTNQQGEAVTLYEVGYDKSKFGELPHIEYNEQPIVHYVKGLEVKIWVERGLLMASVKAP